MTSLFADYLPLSTVHSAHMGKPKALVSVSDKTGLVGFTRELINLGFEILSTSGTFSLLQQHHIPVTEVSQYTGFPEMLDGRVKTLHPKIHAGILARHKQDDAVLKKHGIEPISLVVVNLYPFEEKTQDPNLSFANAMEWIDIGGPTLIRAAAKNSAFVTVIVSPDDYEEVLTELKQKKAISEKTRQALAAKAFAHTAHYDKVIADYFEQRQNPSVFFKPTLRLELKKIQDLRYGENPHQKAALYADPISKLKSTANLQQLQGKPLSFNNLVDSNTAIECVSAFTIPACVIVKHANPCGVANGQTMLLAYEKAYATDPTSAFGGIIAFNQVLDEKTASLIIQKQFVEVILAPSVSDPAKRVLAQKPNLRLITFDSKNAPKSQYEFKEVTGGLLVQEKDAVLFHDLQVVTKKAPSEAELQDLQFAWVVAKYVKSNAIVYAHGLQTLGIGAGQMSRIDSARIARLKATDVGLTLKNAVMASDAFFPFRDSVDIAAKEGVSAIIQPGGSLKDKEVIDAADKYGMAMVFTGIRHFRH